MGYTFLRAFALLAPRVLCGNSRPHTLPVEIDSCVNSDDIGVLYAHLAYRCAGSELSTQWIGLAFLLQLPYKFVVATTILAYR